MPQSLSNIVVHICFSTKDRQAWLRDPTVRDEFFHYLGGVSAHLGCPTIIVGGHIDHIHLLGRLARTITIADWVKELKRVSSTWAKERFPDLRLFHWQEGYGAFSVSQSGIDRAIEYIRNQEAHHDRLSFQDEFRTLLTKHKIAWDERYVWD
jgi:REP element-mobilizing transposase RayT